VEARPQSETNRREEGRRANVAVDFSSNAAIKGTEF